MKDERVLTYCAEWDADKRSSWSGTTYSLYAALQKYCNVKSVELYINHHSPLDEIVNKINKLDFNIQKMNNESVKFWQQNSSPQLILQFSEAPWPNKRSKHYIYQDLSALWLKDCVTNDPELFRISGFGKIPRKAIVKRAELQKRFYDLADGIFLMGKWQADYLVERWQLPRNKVHWVGGGYNAVPHDEYNRKGNVFLFVGRDFRRKGGDLVLSAFTLLRKFDKSLKLYIAGVDCVHFSKIDGVSFLGDISREELEKYFSIADVFVMPSRFEAYGLVFLEAMAAGIPCVGRNAFEMQHFISDGVNGRLVSSDDVNALASAMYECLKSNCIKRNAANYKRIIMNKYSWDSVARKIMNYIG